MSRGWTVRILAALFVGAVLAFEVAPLVPVVISSFSAATIVRFPPEGFSLHWYPAIPAGHWRALGVSLAVGAAAALSACVLGVPAAFALVRGEFPGRSLIQAVLMSPLQVPLVVAGIVFMHFYFWIQRALGVALIGSVTGLTIAHAVLGVPFVIGTVGPILQRFRGELEEAALSLGASRWRTIRRVTLPVVSPGIFAGGMYAFIASFGNVAASIFLVSTRTMTLPVEIFYAMEFDMRPSILAMSTLVILLSAVLVGLVYRFMGVEPKGHAERVL